MKAFVTRDVYQNVLFHLLALSFLVLLTFPRIIINYGIDGDSIRGMLAARWLMESNQYIPSRLPGNPIYEYILGIFSTVDGYYLTNSFSFLSFLLAILAFHKLTANTPNRFLLIVLFSFTPILMKNAALTMDYIPGLALILWGYYFLQQRHLFWSAVLLSLSIGMRLSHAVFIIPFSMYFMSSGHDRRKLASFLGIVITGILLSYLPILLRFGPGLWRLVPAQNALFSHIYLAVYNAIMLFGLPSLLVFSFILILELKQKHYKMMFQLDPASITEFTSFLLVCFVFLIHPDETEYLIPAIPFLYLLVGKLFERKHLMIFVCVVFSFSFFSIELKSGESGNRKVGFAIAPGIIIDDFLKRKQFEAMKRSLIDLPVPEKSIIITGFGPMLGFENPDLRAINLTTSIPELDAQGIFEDNFSYQLRNKKVFLIGGMSLKNAEIARHHGFYLYFFRESAPSLSINHYGYHPRQAKMKKLIFTENEFRVSDE